MVADLYSRYTAHFADVFAEGKPYTRFKLGGRENPMRFTVRDWHPTGDTPSAGRVIWKQEQLGDDALSINGFWAVDVIRAGRYSIHLSRFPGDAPAPIKASTARLQVGDRIESKEVDPHAVTVRFELDLPTGETRLQTWFSDAATGRQRGAYFVKAEWIGR